GGGEGRTPPLSSAGQVSRDWAASFFFACEADDRGSPRPARRQRPGAGPKIGAAAGRLSAPRLPSTGPCQSWPFARFRPASPALTGSDLAPPCPQTLAPPRNQQSRSQRLETVAGCWLAVWPGFARRGLGSALPRLRQGTRPIGGDTACQSARSRPP